MTHPTEAGERERALKIADKVADEYGRQTGDDLDRFVLVEALSRANLLRTEPSPFRSREDEAYAAGENKGAYEADGKWVEALARVADGASREVVEALNRASDEAIGGAAAERLLRTEPGGEVQDSGLCSDCEERFREGSDKMDRLPTGDSDADIAARLRGLVEHEPLRKLLGNLWALDLSTAADRLAVASEPEEREP